MGTGTAPAPAGVPVVYAQGVPVPGYGGFWIRFVAFVIDGIIVRLITIPFTLAFAAMGIVHNIDRWGDMDQQHLVLPFVGAALATLPIILAANWLYEALLTSSEWQATLGKKLFNLRVTDEGGNRISFARATGRHFAKFYLSAFLLIGFIMAAFADRKRALHDLIAGTLVRKN